MSYRQGAYVIDTRENRLAQVVGGTDARVQVRRPGGGGRPWEVPFTALRLATRAEREAAGLRASAARPPLSPVGCKECAELEAARRQAVLGRDKEEITDATVAIRSHFRNAHILPRRDV
ncbi:hypothetical protein GCM10010218_17820 [Streptomyces mashuensis]|uniref:Uncharacterized protein n=1 Tax=Streptomyces mashuensis TaxID=33904 RepID=A0A919B0A7_9ACTN|nr:hypothetical protein [Streptomyces mashuensis]GHF36713.1 hypothetical protein GCM10010218_17820 [Streptomyces mashuensis]